jgi:hypothetical protein
MSGEHVPRALDIAQTRRRGACCAHAEPAEAMRQGGFHPAKFPRVPRKSRVRSVMFGVAPCWPIPSELGKRERDDTKRHDLTPLNRACKR